MSAVKEEVASLLERLPEDATIEDVQYHLYVVEKVRKGMEAARTKGAVPQTEAEEKLAKWLIS